MMKEIRIKIDDEIYSKVEQFVSWKNTRNLLTNKEVEYTVEDFIEGSLLYRLEDIETFVRLTNAFANNMRKELKIKNRFKQIAKDKNVRQAEICRQLNINKANMSMIFNNKMQPNIETFFRLWVFLGCLPIHRCLYTED